MVTMSELLDIKRWYYGDTTTQSAEKLLSNQKVGTFIVRKSKSNCELLVISVKTADSEPCVQHVTTQTPFVDGISEREGFDNLIKTLSKVSQVNLENLVTFVGL